GTGRRKSVLPRDGRGGWPAALGGGGRALVRRGPLPRERAGTRKSRELAANAACTISAALRGIDLVFEGQATRVTDGPTLDRLAALYRAQGWPAEVEDDAFTAPYSAPSAGPPPWHLYRFTFHTAFGVAG